MAKKRVDVLMVERGLCSSRAVAQRLVMAGQVRINGQLVLKASSTVQGNVAIEIEQPPPYVSRGGEKLAAALANFPIHVHGKTCADIGASTGGFTDCLLQHGARRVYAIDVGKGILHWKLRQDARVVVMEETNARHVEKLPEAVDLVTVDASFISLKILLPALKAWVYPEYIPSSEAEAPPLDSRPKTVVALIKPQFEAGRSEVARGDGVIRDAVIHRRILQEILEFAREEGFAILGLMKSPLIGPKGNVEFLAWMEYPADDQASPIEIDLDQLTGL
jgi:23S rRNA (cytidine1920-2'-O)/16S rRNA (cytidine1409-2'-O)-methyltransferase